MGIKLCKPDLWKEIEMSKRNLHYRDLAREVGISDMAMYRRMIGATKRSLHEAIKIMWLMNGVDINKLFEKKEEGRS